MPSEKRLRQRERHELKVQAQVAVAKRRRRGRTAVGALFITGLIVLVVFLVSSKSPTKPAATGIQTVSTAVAPTCPPAKGTAKRYVLFTKAPGLCIAKNSVFDAKVDTDVGNFTIQLKASYGVAGVNNFVFLARHHYYDTTKFQRVVQGFVVQGGDPAGTGSGINPGYSFTGSIPPASCVKKGDCYATGDVALANTGKPSSDGGQFFIVLPGGAPALSDDYTVIGTVVSGMSVVDAIGADGSATSDSTGTPTVEHHMNTVTITQVSS